MVPLVGAVEELALIRAESPRSLAEVEAERAFAYLTRSAR